MPSLAATITQLIVAHTVGSGVVDGIGLAETPAAQEQALIKARRADKKEPPRSVVRGWQLESLDVGAPLHLLGKERPGVLLYLHGGAYVVGPNLQQWRSAATLADRAGLDLAVLAYETGPEGQVDAAIDASVASLDSLDERYEVVTVFADSAGAGLALAAMQTQRERSGPQPTLTVLFSPWVDAALDAPDLAKAEEADVLLSIAGLRGCARLFAGDLALEDPRLSPLRGSMEQLPPTLLHVGTRDLLLGDARRLHAKLQHAGVQSELHEHEGVGHVFFLFPCRESRRVMASLTERLRGVLPPS